MLNVMETYFMYRAPVAAINPCFPIELRDIQDFLAELGPYNGQYVARFPSNWMDEFSKHLDHLAPVERQTAKASLEKIRVSLVDSNLSYNENLNWASNVKESKADQRYKPIVGHGLDPGPFESWPVALPKLRDSKVRTWKFHGTWREYFEAIYPLLLNAPAAYLIDRYFDPYSQDSENLLSSILEKIKGSRCYQLHVITRLSQFARDQKNDADVDKEFKPGNALARAKIQLDRIYKTKIPTNRTLEFHFIAEDAPNGKNLRMHNRYFLTKYGAIDFGQGFDIKEQPVPQMDAHIVDKLHHANHCATFIDGVTRHKERLPKKQGIAYPITVDSHKIEK